MKKDTLHATLSAVRDSSLLGVISAEITAKTGISNNRVTAALSRLTDFGCVRREKIYGYASRYRYWFVRDISSPDLPPPPPDIDVPVTRRVEGYQPKPAAAPMPPPPAPHRRMSKVDMSGVTIRLAIDGVKPVVVSPIQARKVYNQLRVIFGG